MFYPLDMRFKISGAPSFKLQKPSTSSHPDVFHGSVHTNKRWGAYGVKPSLGCRTLLVTHPDVGTAEASIQKLVSTAPAADAMFKVRSPPYVGGDSTSFPSSSKIPIICNLSLCRQKPLFQPIN